MKSLDALQGVIRSDQTISDPVRQQALDWSTRFWDARFGTRAVKDENGNIQEIDFRNSGVRDAGLIHLAGEGLTNLTELDLVGTQVTDAGLVLLKGFTNLKNLGLSNTKITRGEIAELQKALPNCRISY